MWYIVKTDFYKEQGAIDDLLKLEVIEEVYFPVIRRELDEIGVKDSRPIRFKPVINGILFIYATDVRQLKKLLTPKGYFLKDCYMACGMAGKRQQVYGNAHIFTYSTEPESIDSILEKARISDEDIYRYKVCIEQRAACVEEIRIVGESYNRLVSENDTIMIIDGPFAGFTGVIRQLKSRGVKDRHLFFRLGNMCVSLSGVRRFNYIVISESGKGKKALLPNTWRHIDFLTGRLQQAYFADTASSALRSILYHYNKAASIDECQKLLLRSAKVRTNEVEVGDMALQAAFLGRMDDMERSALESLKRFFCSADNSVARGLEELIPDMPLRPFLTPTSGVCLPENRNFVLFRHADFIELILRVNLKDVFIRPDNTGRHVHDDFVYYAHIALKPDSYGSGMAAMVNWGGFIHRYVGLTDDERMKFLGDLNDKGYKETVRLLTHGNVVHHSPYFCGFATAIHGLTLDDVVSQYDLLTASGSHLPLPLLRRLYPVCRLVRDCIPAAVELWQRQRFLEWRHLVQRFVLLHNLPLENGGQ